MAKNHRWLEFTLRGEGLAPIDGPTDAQIGGAIDRMNYRDASHFVVQLANNHYVQVAGSMPVFTVEYCILAEPFIHLVAGKPPISNETYRIRMSMGSVGVRMHERMTKDDVVTLIGSFLRHEHRPAGYIWRNITEEITGKVDPNQSIADLFPKQ